MMLPGDYLAWLLTGEVTTTCSGLSEAVLWDFPGSRTAAFLLEHYGIPAGMLPPLVPAFGVQGRLTGAASASLGVRAGVPVSYRAGDQPNNAYALNVLAPGEIAATAGASGVVYGVLDRPRFDPDSRVNTFVHVNHTDGSPRYGMLLCVNGAGILNSWVRHNGGGAAGLAYDEMNRLAATAPAGCDGLSLLPFGNGAERTLGNAAPGCSVHNLQFTRHTRAHLYRAAQEGIVFALAAGMGIMRKAGCSVSKVRAGNANMFLSPVFCEAFAGTTHREPFFLW